MKYPVNEVFETMQGEATWTGSPSVFVRMQGCPVGCPWCDTKHTWEVDSAAQVSTAEMVEKVDDAPTFALMSEGAVLALMRDFRAKHIVITGGEPAMYDLLPLSLSLIEHGYRIQLETSGTFPVQISDRAWVTVSPKVGMPGGRPVLESAMRRADEIKYPVGKPADVEKLKALLAEFPVTCPVWLQPLSQNDKATQLCLEAATQNDWRVSLQTHKFLGVR